MADNDATARSKVSDMADDSSMLIAVTEERCPFFFEKLYTRLAEDGATAGSVPSDDSSILILAIEERGAFADKFNNLVGCNVMAGIKVSDTTFILKVGT